MDAVVSTLIGDQLVVFDFSDWSLFEGAGRWYVNDGYVTKNVRIPGTRRTVRRSFHREVLGLSTGDGLIVDHINRNRLDNRKSNLRLVTRRQNAINAGKKPSNTSGYKGVHPHRGSKLNPWVVQLGRLYLGCHPTAEAAAKAYDAAAKEIHGEYAVLNFPEKS